MLNSEIVRSGTRSYLSFVLAIIIATIGCSSTVPAHPEYNVQSVDSYEYSQVLDGLRIAVHPIKAASECEEYFGENLISLGILPVLVVAENENTASSFILTNDQFSLLNAEDASLDRSKVGDERTWATINTIALGDMFFASMAFQKVEAKQMFAEKEFRAKTLSPGSTTSGFVYFQFPEKKISEGPWVVQVKAIRPIEQETRIFNIKFE